MHMLASRVDARAVNSVAQLTHISGPGVPHRHPHSILFNGCDGMGKPAIALLDEVLDKYRDVFSTLAQGGYLNYGDIEAVVEIGAKPSRGHLFIERFIGCGDDPDINLLSLMAPHPLDTLGLHSPQQAGLDRRRGVPALIEKQGASVS